MSLRPRFVSKSSFLLMVLAALLCSSLLVVAQSSAPAKSSTIDPITGMRPNSAPPVPTGTPDGESIISPDDTLDIFVMDATDLTRQYRVSPAGTVTFPLLSAPLKAAGMTTSDFADLLAQQLHDEGIVMRANIVVSIVSSRDKAVAITGAVRMPQLYPVYGHTTLLDVISQAQGLLDDASNICVVSRGNIGMQTSGATDRVQTVDLKKLMQSGDPAYNLYIYPGDHVTVPKAGIIYVVGAVHKPGGFPIKSAKDGMTVMQALAMAEDMTSTAIKSKAVLIRVDATAEHGRKQLPINMSDLLAGKAPDPVLQEDDILYIPDSAAKKALHRTMDAAIQVATGIAIYGRY